MTRISMTRRRGLSRRGGMGHAELIADEREGVEGLMPRDSERLVTTGPEDSEEGAW